MTENELTELEKLKARLGIKGNDEDVNLTVILEDAEDDALGYTNQEKVIGGMKSAIRDLAIVRYNQEGNEGETARSEGGISHSFEEGIPLKIKTKLDRFVLGKVVSFYAP